MGKLLNASLNDLNIKDDLFKSITDLPMGDKANIPNESGRKQKRAQTTRNERDCREIF
jgi:hypothetical protein